MEELLCDKYIYYESLNIKNKIVKIYHYYKKTIQEEIAKLLLNKKIFCCLVSITNKF